MNDIIRPLTPRERQILHKICEGLTAREIGDFFDIAQSTVESYKQKLLAKFGAKNAVDLALKAERLGYLQD